MALDFVSFVAFANLKLTFLSVVVVCCKLIIFGLRVLIFTSRNCSVFTFLYFVTPPEQMIAIRSSFETRKKNEPLKNAIEQFLCNKNKKENLKTIPIAITKNTNPKKTY